VPAEADAELAAAYIVGHVKEQSRARAFQGARRPALRRAAAGSALDMVATMRLSKVPEPVARGLVAWAYGERQVHLLTRVPRAEEVLAWQAVGERCVSLLAKGMVTAPHDDGLAFALHDLCHLEKLADEAHHAEQVGFFGAVHRVSVTPVWKAFVERFDHAFTTDLEHVVADMNGSAVFLFAALKMKLKMAVRRKLSPDAGERRTWGPLDAGELAAFETELTALLELLDVSGEVRDAARRVSTRRDDHDAALALARYFARLGEDALAARWRAVS
jgi:hypothetical protein